MVKFLTEANFDNEKQIKNIFNKENKQGIYMTESFIYIYKRPKMLKEKEMNTATKKRRIVVMKNMSPPPHTHIFLAKNKQGIYCAVFLFNCQFQRN